MIISKPFFYNKEEVMRKSWIPKEKRGGEKKILCKGGDKTLHDSTVLTLLWFAVARAGSIK